MALDIKEDLGRFKDKLKRLKNDGLERYFNRDTMIVPRPDGKTISVPIDTIYIPHFVFGNEGEEGIGQGDGDIGDVIHSDDSGYGTGHGSGAGHHNYHELTLEEAAKYLSEEMKLPNLLDKFGGDVVTTSTRKYKTIQPVGPHSLRHPKRTFKQGLKRSIASGSYDPDDPVIILRKGDERFKASVEQPTPGTKAAVIWMMDYSRSMHKVLPFLQNVGWWANAWIEKHYEQVKHRRIHYDSFAKEVDRPEFFSAGAGGGTSMLAGLQLAKKIARTDYPPEEYNLFLIHFTDGDCFGITISEEEVAWHQKMAENYPNRYSLEDMPEVGNPLTDYLIPRSNAIFVCEAGAYYGSNGFSYGGQVYEGNFSHMLEKLVEQRPVLGKKLRVVSYKEDEIAAEPGKKVKETLLHWFS